MSNRNELEQIIGYFFKNNYLLEIALTHPSYANEKGLEEDNQRLEFLGDAVLGLVIAEMLYKRYPQAREGSLSKTRSVLASGKLLVDIAKELRISDYILLGSGEANSGGQERPSNLADAFEALVGAVYLDSNFCETFKILSPIMEQWLEKFESYKIHQNYKSELQELSQKKYGQIPVYKILDEHGPEHDKTFSVEVWIRDDLIAKGFGTTKKDAEQLAAKSLLDFIQEDGNRKN
mgnify:FL=1